MLLADWLAGYGIMGPEQSSRSGGLSPANSRSRWKGSMRWQRRLRVNAMADRNEVAAYTAPMLADLAALARRSGLTLLAYVIEMAELQAREDAGERRE